MAAFEVGGVFPWNPDKVLGTMPLLPGVSRCTYSELKAQMRKDEARAAAHLQQVPPSTTTPQASSQPQVPASMPAATTPRRSSKRRRLSVQNATFSDPTHNRSPKRRREKIQHPNKVSVTNEDPFDFDQDVQRTQADRIRKASLLPWTVDRGRGTRVALKVIHEHTR